MRILDLFCGAGGCSVGYARAGFDVVGVDLCAHDAAVKPCLVLDPFMGSGTTALVARRLGRHAIGIELNAEYLAIAARRLEQPTLWSAPADTRPPPLAEQMTIHDDE